MNQNRLNHLREFVLTISFYVQFNKHSSAIKHHSYIMCGKQENVMYSVKKLGVHGGVTLKLFRYRLFGL